MKVLNQYIIPLKGLSAGKHKFNMLLDNQSFRYWANPLCSNGDIVASLMLDKKGGFYELDIQLDGEANVSCDRCLDIFKTDINNNFRLILKHSEKEGDHIQGDVELKFIAPDCNQYNIGQDLLEYVLLSLPMRKICNSAKCADNLERFKGTSKKQDIDPRWEALTNLK